MKEKVKRAGILTFVFLIAVIVFSFLTNQGNADMTADMGERHCRGYRLYRENMRSIRW